MLGSGERWDKLEQTTCQPPAEWWICRAGAARRQSQTKVCQSSIDGS